MESMFIGIVLFSGAAVLLLGVFLVASEKELKKKRGEINELLTRLESAPAPIGAATTMASNINDAEVDALRTKNRELQKDLASLQDDLAAAHLAIDDLRATTPAVENGSSLDEIYQLRGANTELSTQIEQLRRQLQASEAKLQAANAPGSETSERQTQLESSIIELKQQLEKSQSKIRELENTAAPVVDVSAIEAGHRAENQKLQSTIDDLEKRMSEMTTRAQQMDGMEQRMREAATVEQELRAALSQREAEIPQWQERLAASDEIKKRLMALQPVYNQLVAKQNSLIDQQRQYHGELKSFAQFLSASHDGTMTAPTYYDPQNSRDENLPTQLLLTPAVVENDNGATNPADTNGNGAVNGETELSTKGNRGFGVFHALIAAVVGGALIALFWSQKAEQPASHAAKPQQISAPLPKAAPEAVRQPPAAAKETAEANEVSQRNVPVVQKNSTNQAKSQPDAVAGTYEVTRGTRVFAAPTEFAQQVGEITPGLKVNVVNARDGWLEIHSKHGRPPGFIRSDTVARVGG